AKRNSIPLYGSKKKNFFSFETPWSTPWLGSPRILFGRGPKAARRRLLECIRRTLDRTLTIAISRWACCRKSRTPSTKSIKRSSALSWEHTESVKCQGNKFPRRGLKPFHSRVLPLNVNRSWKSKIKRRASVNQSPHCLV